MSVDNSADIEAYKKAYRERQKNFSHLKNGLIKKYVEEALDLKDRQQESIFKITDTSADDYTLASGYFHACTAFGKTYLMLAMAEGYHAEKNDKKIVIFEENTSVLEQVRQDFTEKTSFDEKDIGAFYGEEKNIDTPIIVCTYTSMEKMVKQVGIENIGLVLCDEAHHILSENRQRVAKEFNGCCLYGFTATPDFSESKSCAQVFGEVIDEVTLAQGVNVGLLCSVKNGLMVSKIPVDLTDCKSSSGDYDDEKLIAAIEKASHTKGIRESLAKFYLNGTDEDIGKIYGKTALINVPNQKEADKLALVFNEMAGLTVAKAYHTNSGDEPLQEFNAGRFPVLIQVNRLSEGYSNPKIELCINYPTASQVREAQCSGRALRADKENLHKMALILDIVFKKENGTDVYEEIARNGQVLFKDIAKDVCVLSPDYQRAVSETTNPKEQQDTSPLTDDMLFDVITDYEDLFKLAMDHEQYLEDSFIPDKENMDIGKYDFKKNFDVYDANRHQLTFREKDAIFDKLKEMNNLQQKCIIAERKTAAGLPTLVIIGKKLAEFTQVTGLMLVKKEKNENVAAKNKDDIGKEDFMRIFNVYDASGQQLKGAEKGAIFDKLKENMDLQQKNIIAERKTATGQFTLVIIGKKLAEFTQITGLTLVKKEKNENVETKDKDDIGKADFIRGFNVYDANGVQLTKEKKSALFDKLKERDDLLQKGIISEKNTTSGQPFPVIIGKKLAEFTQVTGLRLVNKEQKEKKENIETKDKDDIGREVFVRNFDVYNANGRQLLINEKIALFEKLKEREDLRLKGIIAERKTASGQPFTFIIGKKLAEFTQITGYRIVSPLEQLHELQQKAAEAATSAEKNKYQTRAQRLFEKLYPELKKQNLCSACLEKISGNHK